MDVAGSATLTIIYVVLLALLGFAFAFYYFKQTAHVDISAPLLQSADGEVIDGNSENAVPARDPEASGGNAAMSVKEIADAIAEGANSFLKTEYKYMGVFLTLFGAIVFIVLGAAGKEMVRSTWQNAFFTVICFAIGALTSTLAGFIGMRVAVFANSRTAMRAQLGYGPAFLTAFKAGAVMGFSLVALGTVSLLVTIVLLWMFAWHNAYDDIPSTVEMYEAIAGFGLGGSCVALFGRVGGGIYTKAADVGADLVGKVEQGIPEDDPRNPAVIADNVGDNVGDIAGMGADLFGSFAESSCACMVLSSTSPDLYDSFASMTFPLILISSGLAVSIVTAFFATHLFPVREEHHVEKVLKQQLIVSTIIMTPVSLILSVVCLPGEFKFLNEESGKEEKTVKAWEAFFCIACGLWSGMIIGYFTEYYTSFSYKPVKDVAQSCQTGAATNIIYGLSLGYKSTIIPAMCMTATIYVSFTVAGMYGISLAALGILSTMATGLTIDAYGPISDNAGGIAEMAHMAPRTRQVTDCLDAAGNTTAAIGKGFAIGSAAFVSLALFGAFVTAANMQNVNILQPKQFGGLMLGAMLPYWFSAMTMRSVGEAALSMVYEVRKQFQERPGIMQGTERPSYSECVRISTNASIKEMIAPSALVIFSPLVVGFLFGKEALAGMLAGALTSGVQMAISASNTGGAWDNAKKFIEKGNYGGKGSPEHKAAVVGDTVGDPLKDTSGPALNILVKLMAIISLVFARTFPKKGLFFEIFG